ncbi:MAG: DNA-processing protein DprA [Planctomycetota bacterium]
MPRQPSDIPDAALRMVLAAEAGPSFHHDALLRLGSFDAVASAPLVALAGCGRAAAGRLEQIHRGMRAADPDAERRAMEACGVVGILLGDPDYPPLLAPLPLPPVLLWVRGRVQACAEDAVAVVGARRATAYGEGQASRFAASLAGHGMAIVSGGARGVDAAAHRAALRVGGTTVAVLGCGLGDPYPEEHAGLFESIVDAGGLLVSEFPVRWPPRPANFPRRNRIISGLSLTVVVVEAGVASGALVTARHAIDDHQREPCAVPGPVDSPRSAGCNAAIRDGWAHCVLDPEDVLRIAGSATERIGRAAGVRPDLDGLGIPPELREPVMRATELLARRPRIPTEGIADELGIDHDRARSVRVFAALVRSRITDAPGPARRTSVAAPDASIRRSPGAGAPGPADQVQPMA